MHCVRDRTWFDQAADRTEDRARARPYLHQPIKPFVPARMDDRLRGINLVPYLLAGFLINLGSFALSLLTYFNPKTYSGKDGFNDGLIILLILVPVWTIILMIQRKKRNRAASLGYGIMATISILFYLMITVDRL